MGIFYDSIRLKDNTVYTCIFGNRFETVYRSLVRFIYRQIKVARESNEIN